MKTKLLDPEYRNCRKTKLCSDKHCRDEIKVEMKERLGLDVNDEYLCTSKMLRKTYTHKCKSAFNERSDKKLLFADTDHLTEYGAIYMGKLLEKLKY